MRCAALVYSAAALTVVVVAALGPCSPGNARWNKATPQPTLCSSTTCVMFGLQYFLSRSTLGMTDCALLDLQNQPHSAALKLLLSSCCSHAAALRLLLSGLQNGSYLPLASGRILAAAQDLQQAPRCTTNHPAVHTDVVYACRGPPSDPAQDC